MSSSNITGNVKQESKLRKVNSRYFSLKWKRDCGESGKHGNNLEKKMKLTTDKESIERKVTHGFFHSIKKKMSIKNLYKSKRKIINMDTPSSVLDTDSNNSILNFNEPVLLNDERNIVEIKDRTGTINLNSENNLSFSVNTSNNDSDKKYTPSDNYLNLQPNINNIECDRNDFHEHSQNYRINAISRNTSHANNHVNNTKNCDTEKITEKENNSEEKYQTNLLRELRKLRKYGWYWGNTSGDVADAALLSEPDGAFLIRDSSDRRHLLTLSFKSAGKLLHTRVEHSGGMFSLCNQGESGRFSSVPELIDHSMNFSKYAVFCYSRPRHPCYPAFPVRLTKPVSRFNRVRSLQYLCRFVIRQNTRWDNIHKLPLPKSLQVYIEEGHY